MNISHIKLGKDEVMYARYCDDNCVLTHILIKKLNADTNKMWILLSVEDDGKTKKVAHGSNPVKLEDKIDYIKAIKDSR